MASIADTAPSSNALYDIIRKFVRTPAANRIARHPALRAAIVITHDVTMTATEKQIAATSIGVFLHPTTRTISANHNLTWGGMPGFNPLSAAHWSSDVFSGSQYGAFISGEEKILLANDVLSHAAGYPVDITDITPEKAREILDNYQAELDSEVTPAAVSAVTAGNIRVTRSAEAEEIDCFNLPEGVDREEFEQQLKEQQDEINNTDIDILQARRQTFRDGEAVRDRRAQRNARTRWKDIEALELETTGNYSRTEAIAEAQKRSLTLDATHVLDMVAGGDPSKISGLGNSRINRSIGSQWKGRRVRQLDGKLAEQKAQGRKKPEIELKVC